MQVNCAMNAAAVTPFAAAESLPCARRAIDNHAIPYTSTSSPVTSAAFDQSLPAAPLAHPSTTTAAAITPAACSAGARVASEAALAASVTTANAPSIGHGGDDHSAFAAMKSRKRWPTKAR